MTSVDWLEKAERWADQVDHFYHYHGHNPPVIISDTLLFTKPPTGEASLFLRGFQLTSERRRMPSGYFTSAVFIDPVITGQQGPDTVE